MIEQPGNSTGGKSGGVRGWVYVISNPDMPGLVKVGFSLKDPKLRANHFAGEQTPSDFRVEFDALVMSPREVEQKAHSILSAVHHRKEWFKCSAREAAEAIEKAAGTRLLLRAEKPQKPQSAGEPSDATPTVAPGLVRIRSGLCGSCGYRLPLTPNGRLPGAHVTCPKCSIRNVVGTARHGFL